MECCWLLFFLLASSVLAVLAIDWRNPESCTYSTPQIKCTSYMPEVRWLNYKTGGKSRLRQLWLDKLMMPALESRSREILDCESPNFYCEKLEAITLTRYTWPPERTDALAVTAKLLSSLPQLKHLNVSHNDFEDIDWVRDIDRPTILTFNASHNRLHSMGYDTFRGMTQLTELILSDNHLPELAPAYERLEKLQLLDVSNNRILKLHDVLRKMPELRRLNLAGNRISFLLSDYFQDLRSLVELDISRNAFQFIRPESLQSLGSLAVLNLSENRLIERDLSLLLDSVRRLEVVDASRIGLWRVPATLTRSVKIMRLVGNQLTAINSGDFDSYPLLEFLDLSGNKLIMIEDDALGRLDNLEELNLYGNILSSVPKSLPSNLKILDLRQNTIATVNANDLRGLSELKRLDLSGNVICSIENGAFGHTRSLGELDISDNPIKRLTSDAFGGTRVWKLRMSGLTEFKLDENQNQDTAFPYSTPERLGLLDLSRSSSLAALFLADNATLSACKSLHRLDLSNTNVSIRSDLHYVLPALEQLTLLGNEFNCSTWKDEASSCHEHESVGFSSWKRKENLKSRDTTTTTKQEATTTKLPGKIIDDRRSSTSQMKKEFDMLVKPTATPPTTIVASTEYATTTTELPTTRVEETVSTAQTRMQTIEEEKTTSQPSSTIFIEERPDLYTITSEPKAVNKQTTAVDDNQSSQSTTATTTTRLPQAAMLTPTSSYRKKLTTTTVRTTTADEEAISSSSEDQPAVINLENDLTTTVYEEKLSAAGHMFSEFSRSKVLLANDDDEQASAEELINAHGQRSAEFFSSGAHPGMLVLVGAVIGAAAALTVVLSRRATAKRQHRQENIALTPTTERW